MLSPQIVLLLVNREFRIMNGLNGNGVSSAAFAPVNEAVDRSPPPQGQHMASVTSSLFPDPNMDGMNWCESESGDRSACIQLRN
jgi:hypothetical protein